MIMIINLYKMGITSLTDIYRKKGKEFTNKLFDNYVTINEKIDGSAFSVEKNYMSNELEFFKRDNHVPISLIDRTLAKFYERPIAHFEKLDVKTLAKMQPGWRFGFEYLVSEMPQEISYDRTPKNHLILSYIHVKNRDGKIVRTIQDRDELDKWAETLEVERSPIIFQGVLSDEQKLTILDFLDTSKDDLAAKFKTESFVRYIISVLNPKLKKTLLNDDLAKPIEGVVFRFGSDDKDVTLAKMVDPIFHELSKTKSNKRTGGNDIYYITLLDVMNFIDNANFNKFKPKGRTYDERYINFICGMFNAIVDEMGEDYEDMDFDEPEYLKKPEFDINDQFIKDPVALSNIDRATGLKKLFKIMLASFKKKRRKVTGIFSKEVLDQFNLTVDRINQHLMQNLMLKVNESEIPLFGDFLNKRGRSAEVEDEEADEDDAEADDFDATEFRNKMNDISKTETEDEDPKTKCKKKGKKVNMIVGRFQPFHNGHMEMVEELYAANKKPVLIIAVHPGHNKSGKSPFSMSTMRSILNNLQADAGGKICGYRIIGRGYIGDIINAVRPEFEPILWGVGPDRINGYQKQLELNYMRKNELDLDDNFTLMETKRYMSGDDVREKIFKDHFGSFKDMVPKCVQTAWPLLRNDIIKYEQQEKEEE